MVSGSLYLITLRLFLIDESCCVTGNWWTTFKDKRVTGRGHKSRSLVVLVAQWFDVGLVIERSLVQLPAGVLSRQLGQRSLSSLRGR